MLCLGYTCIQGRLFEYTNVEPDAEAAALARSLLQGNRDMLHQSTGKCARERINGRHHPHCVAQIVNEMTWTEFCLKRKTANKMQRRQYFDLVLMVHSIYYIKPGIFSSLLASCMPHMSKICSCTC